MMSYLEVWGRLSGLKLDDKVVVGPQRVDAVLGLDTLHFAFPWQVGDLPGKAHSGGVLGGLEADHNHVLGPDSGHQLNDQLGEGLLVAGHEIVGAQTETDEFLVKWR